VERQPEGEPAAVAKAAANVDLAVSVLAAIEALGADASGDAIEGRVRGDHNATRRELKALVKTGTVVKSGKARATRYRVSR